MDVLSDLPPRLRRAITALVAIPALYGSLAPHALAAGASRDDFVTVHARTVVHTLRAYGQIEPTAVVEVRAVEPGTLRGLGVVPGSIVAAGDVLARLGGPRMQSLLTTREQTLRSAQARVDAASHTLKIVRRMFTSRQTTRQAIDAAKRELAAARAAVRTAQARLREARSLQTLHAPAAGTVISVQAANGEQTTAGETILSLQPAGKLWLRAAYYGADARLLRVGMSGRFQPSDDGHTIPVKIAAIAPGIAPDGGRSCGLLPTSSPSSTDWVDGQWGTVTLEGPSRRMVAVPTSALVLDHGNWWVMVHTTRGDEPHKVVPGPTRGWQTWIASGLHPGQQVVAQDAFLEYHRGIARSYQPPD